jgi:hypothetical protein
MKIKLCLTAVLFVITFVGVQLPAKFLIAQRPVRIVSIGDSNTGGGHDAGFNYRGFLQQSLSEGGIDFDFVGSLTSGLIGEDRQHEGHSGRGVGFFSVPQTVGGPSRIDDILANYDPDIALVMLGTLHHFLDAPTDEELYQLQRDLFTVLLDQLDGVEVIITSVPKFNLFSSATQADVDERNNRRLPIMNQAISDLAN